MNGEGEMLLESSVVKEPVKEYNKDTKDPSDVKWYKDALRRADEQIELQKDMIDALKQLLKNKT